MAPSAGRLGIVTARFSELGGPDGRTVFVPVTEVVARVTVTVDLSTVFVDVTKLVKTVVAIFVVVVADVVRTRGLG